ncbi:MAG: FtsW/RodA/SpoVE family cell cycle protein [Ruminococcus sp.]|nr:FtsW/RodA/SpoVE family cell cycle protein [Ruminococcus sp.]
MSNPFSYLFSCIFVIAAHAVMLFNVFSSGSYESSSDAFILAAAVIGLDIAYSFVMLFFRQHTFTVNFMLLLIINMSNIFQSCFGGVSLDVKHYVTGIAALVSCQIGFLLCRSHKRIQNEKKIVYICMILVMIAIVTLTGSRSMWVNIGNFSIQPSEFLKPLLVLACATSITEQQNKVRVWKFYIVRENVILFIMTAAICLLQWWCRDLGSIPTFAAIYAAGFLLRICYPKAKFSKKTLIAAAIAVFVIACVGVYFAPDYVKARLFTDIWSDTSGGGYQQSRALIAIAEGGWFGKGPGKGFLCDIFAHENDIVFASISEEWGLLTALMTVLALLIMISAPLFDPPRSYYHGTLAAGVCAAFTVQMALNIFGSCNLIPFTGVTIPFISAGGSSMVTSGLMTGMLTAAQSPEFHRIPGKKRGANV